MSEEQARKKADEIKKFEQSEVDVLKEIKEDRCPACGMPTQEVEFFNVQLVKMFGWIECTRCGNVYCPKSILKQKQTLSKGGLVAGMGEGSPIVQP